MILLPGGGMIGARVRQLQEDAVRLLTKRRVYSQARERALIMMREVLVDPHADFRDGQWEAIDRLVNGRARLLVVQRTGWGKSAVYFLATRLLREQGAGPTLIISPLLSLMRD